MRAHQTTVNAAAISFLALFAIFSALSAFVAFYGLFANPAIVVADMHGLAGFVPADVVVSLIDQMRMITQRPASTLWAAGGFSSLIALWSAQQGVVALMTALNAAYRQPARHEALARWLRSTLLAIAVITRLVGISILVIGVPVIVQAQGYSLGVSETARAIGMIIGGLILFLGLAALYRWLPERAMPPRWRWVRAGAALVVAFWAVASIGFSVFLAYSDSYTAMYGSASGVVLLLTLTYVTVITLLVGAEFNAQMEARARAAST